MQDVADMQEAVDFQWEYLLTLLPSRDELERSARECGAITRKRGVTGAEALLRLALAYACCGFSLRQTAAWAKLAGIADISDVALLNRLRKAGPWLAHLLSTKLAERAHPPQAQRRIRLFDATSIRTPGSKQATWRLHLGFDLASLTIDQVELSTAKMGEKLSNFKLSAGDIAIGDRGYAQRRGLASVLDADADFIIRLNWSNVPLTTSEGDTFDLIAFLRALNDAEIGECAVRFARSKGSKSTLPARLVAARKSEAAAAKARAKVIAEASRNKSKLDPRTLETAGYVFVLTSLEPSEIAASRVLDLYRFRWQIELAFKRMKQFLRLGSVTGKDPPLARTCIYARLLAAVLLDDLTERFLDFSPWGYRLERPETLPLADSASAD